MLNNVVIFSSNDRRTIKIRKKITDSLQSRKISVVDDYENCDLILCIGGDGTMLNALKVTSYCDKPIIGINTGHLGFFQELDAEQFDAFIDCYQEGRFVIQEYNPVEAVVMTGTRNHRYIGMNEIVIRGDKSTHLKISIDGGMLQRFSGDGILICPPAGSTAYNYSLGGAIMDPSIKALQITPIAPINTSAYRSFISSVVVGGESTITIYPERVGGRTLLILTDGHIVKFNYIEKIQLKLSSKVIKLVRMEDYNYWEKVKGKLLE